MRALGPSKVIHLGEAGEGDCAIISKLRDEESLPGGKSKPLRGKLATHFPGRGTPFNMCLCSWVMCGADSREGSRGRSRFLCLH